MSKKWMIESKLNNNIVPVECVKETRKQAIVLIEEWHTKGKFYESRMNKEGVLFDSFIDAKNYLIEYSKREIASLQSRMDSAKAELKKRNDIPHPAE